MILYDTKEYYHFERNLNRGYSKNRSVKMKIEQQIR
ncbi:hypothetical protein [Cytobacillus sp. IB215665]